MGIRTVHWTGEQAAAVTATGDVLLAASAGTGKTTTVVGKILWMLGLESGRHGEPPEPLPACESPCRLDQVAAITFTEKAAYDLKRKLRAEIEASERGDDLRWQIDNASVGTIHGFCAELLREHALRLEIDPTFRVLDERETRVHQDELIGNVLKSALAEAEPEARALVRRFKGMYDGTHQDGAIGGIREVMRDIRWHSRRYAPWVSVGPDSSQSLDSDVVWAIAGRAGLVDPDPARREHDEEALQTAAHLYRYAHRALSRWLSWLEVENLRDFDSLILDARRLLTRPGTRPALDAVRSRYRILIIDEFQDTDAAQRDIAFAIAGLSVAAGDEGPDTADEEAPPAGRVATRPQLFLVGDPKQSIYRFRGADIGVWNDVRESLGRSGQLLDLSHNFRSEPQVVDFVNRICGPVMSERASDLREFSPRSAVDYVPLRAAVRGTAAAGVEWLVNDKNGNDVKAAEARLVASRIRQLIDREVVRDPETGRCRPCTYSDIAILARSRLVLRGLEKGLRQYGVAFYNSSAGDLADRQEILDVMTALRLVDNPSDDLRAFAYLRSPFVGLRDEVLARIRLDPQVKRATRRPSYLEQARAYLGLVEAGEIEPFQAPENEHVHGVETWALREGLESIDEAHRLVDRADHGEILGRVLDRTGYRLHLLLREHAAEALANIERFQALLEDYRHLPLGGFLRLWDRWGEQDTGIPQAPLTSQDDDAVTLSTIHTSKGLEWPVVIVAGTRGGPDTGGRLSGTFWSDPSLGPVYMGNQKERGDRSERLFGSALAEDHAEEARLLYVAATRARDRLIISGPTEKARGYAEWLKAGLADAVEAHEAVLLREGAGEGARGDGEGRERRAAPPSDDDSATGTGRQLDAFGFDHAPEDERGQLNMFAPRRDSGPDRGADSSQAAAAFARVPLVLFRTPDPIQESLAPTPVELWWMDGLRECPPAPITRPIRTPHFSFSSSATELRMRDLDPEAWELRYGHGVVPARDFDRRPAAAGLPATVRGVLIHTVLERLEAESELSRILGEAIAGLDAPESETLLEPGSLYREKLQEEIAAVVRSEEWSHYVDGQHWRELQFLHVRGPRDWRVGAFDLFRPGASGGAGEESAPRIVDFKTHVIDSAQVPETAATYSLQADVYREAAATILGRPVRVSLHFTHPNVAIEV
jgi:ATP-dependent exoDNAse (exonuclease V) beta subunit